MSIQKIFDAVLEFEEDAIAELVKAEIATGTDLKEILEQGLIGAMDEVGKLFSAGELYVPEMLMAAETMKAGLEEIKPLLKGDEAKSKGIFIIGTVKGDLHDIGKNLCAMMVEGAGYDVIDVGMDSEPEVFLEKIKETGATVIGLSALLTTTMPAMEETIKKIREAGLDTKVIVGGAPVSREYAEKIGADGYGIDAPTCVELVKQFMA
ncbi:cobalamin B12-binding domain-containing protein [Geosporobacter ferrireducens]|uniref:cobalamin B12-binding domain-containing protein n=1 Tax=Geosporobacter ferrireducens TaxID=1424294 RepID=UPI00139EA57B|nr:corrinoid protein [Geosporobacter ferrireducens]MTI56644.1 cobalamin-binding protein [Geosporobacter ferrireducens]